MLTYNIALCGNPNSCIIKIGARVFRSLVDSGAEVSLISSHAFRLLHNPPKLIKKRVNLQSVNGNSLLVEGAAEIRFKIGQKYLTHCFYIVKNINRTVILGRDFLQDNGVRLYFDLGSLRIGDCYVPLEEDVHISSVARLQGTSILKPQTANVIMAKLKRNTYVKQGNSYKIESVSNRFFDNVF